MMSNLCLRDRALDVVRLALGSWVVGRQDGGGSTNDGAHLVVHLLGLGFVDQLVSDEGAGRCVTGGSVGGDGHPRVLVQVVVVVGLGADYRAYLARLGEVNVGMRGGESRVGGAHDRAVRGRGGGHCRRFGFRSRRSCL